jgi:transcriptional regulator with XRE-family HTH domain
MTLRTGFGKALQIARKHRGLTQEDFSQVSSRTYMSTLERGLKSPTLEKVEDLAVTLEIHPITLIALAYMKAERTDLSQLLQRVTAEVKLLTA